MRNIAVLAMITVALTSCQTLPDSNNLSNVRKVVGPGTVVFLKANSDPLGALPVFEIELNRIGIEVQPYETAQTVLSTTSRSVTGSDGDSIVTTGDSKSQITRQIDTNLILDISYTTTFVGLAYGGYGPDAVFVRIVNLSSKKTIAIWEYKMDLWSLDDRSVREVARKFAAALKNK